MTDLRSPGWCCTDARSTALACRWGYSLLEVILALAILMISLVTLTELLRLGLGNAERARELTQAQLLCESKLAEVSAGLLPLSPVAGVPILVTPTGTESSSDPRATWLYDLNVEALEEPGLVAVTVTVYRDPSSGSRLAPFRLFRWIRDPEQVAAGQEATEQGNAEQDNPQPQNAGQGG